MRLGDELVWLGDDHGAGLERRAARVFAPFIPQAGDRQWRFDLRTLTVL